MSPNNPKAWEIVDEADNPSLSKVLERNIRTLAYLRLQTGVSRGWGSIIVWGTVDLEQSEQRKKDRR